MEHKGYIYIMCNSTNSVLYIGVTNSIKRRIIEHKAGICSNFTNKYKCSKFVYYEIFPDIQQAITREKQLKHYKRVWKTELIEKMNPKWEDLAGLLIDDPDIG